MEEFSQIWEHDYGYRDNFLQAIQDINEQYPEDKLVGFSIWWSNIPYDLRLFAYLNYSGSEDSAKKFFLEVGEKFNSIGSVYRGDLTYKNLTDALGRRQLNCHTIAQGGPILVDFAFHTKEFLMKNGYNFERWDSSSKVFLSHQSERKNRVQMLQQSLSANGVSTWFDAVDIDYGENIATAISKGVKESKVVIFWISPKFLESDWCRYEFERFHSRYAGSNDVLILSIVEQSCVQYLPTFLQELKYLKIDEDLSVDRIAYQLVPSINNYFKKVSVKRWSEGV